MKVIWANLSDIPGKFEKSVATVAQTPRAAAGTLLGAHDLYGTEVKIPYGSAPAGIKAVHKQERPRCAQGEFVGQEMGRG